jgi:hypothetical protein
VTSRPARRRTSVNRIALIGCLAAIAAFVPAPAAHAAGWLAAQEVASAEFPVSDPAVAMAPDGDILTAWTATPESGNPAVAYRAREAFNGNKDVGFVGGGGQEKPALTTDSSGRIWFAFNDPGTHDVYLLRSGVNDANSLSGVTGFHLATGPSSAPDLAARPDDAAVAVLAGGQVKLGRWTDPGPGTTTTIYDGPSGNAGDATSARVTLDSAGNLVTVYHYPVLEETCPVEARRIPAGGSLSGIQTLGSTGSEVAGCGGRTDVDLVLGPSERVMASWWNMGGTSSSVDTRIAAPGSTFGPLTTVATEGYDPVTNPEPLAAGGAFDIHPRGLLGASDATLHAYLTKPPSVPIRRISQRFDPAGGGPTVQPFETSVGTADLARNDSDQAVGAWVGISPSCHVSGARGTVGGGLGARQTLGACGSADSEKPPQVAINENGDAAVVWTADDALEMAIYDSTQPQVQGVSVPASGAVGQPLAMSATARDALSDVSTRWEFGDGGGATGGTVHHAYSASGTYHVVAHVRDAAGNTKNVSRTVVVPKGPSPSNEFSLGKAEKNKKKGTAILPVDIPGAGALDLAGKKVKPVDAQATGAGEVDLLVKAKGKARKKLKKKGKAKVAVEVTFTPTGGDPNAQSDSVKLVRKR